MKKFLILLLFSVYTVGAQSYDNYAEMGWIALNGLHTGYGYKHFYFGFNVLFNQKGEFQDTMVVGTERVSYTVESKDVYLQIPLGYQHKFNLGKQALSLRAAWVPAMVMQSASDRGIKTDGLTLWLSPIDNEWYYLDTSNNVYRRLPKPPSNTTFDYLTFSVGAIYHFESPWNISVDAYLPFQDFSRFKVQFAVGYSFLRYSKQKR